MSDDIFSHAGTGHNSGEWEHNKALRDAFARLEEIAQERKILTKESGEIMASLRAQGFDTKAVRRILTLRNTDPAEEERIDDLVSVYIKVLGIEVR